MRILLAHNEYRFRGGEESAVAADRALLESNGHEVTMFTRRYEELRSADGRAGPALAGEAMWSRRSHADLRRLIRTYRPDVAHFHNIFPLISPSAYAACRAERVPVVQTLHNYRLVCPAGTLLRDGAVCELCVGKVPWRAVLYRCYRDSRSESLAMSAILGIHRAIGTWTHSVDAYIVLTEFGKEIFVRGGLPADRLFVRPNAVLGVDGEPYVGPHSAVFIGRLSPEKGITVLLDAWASLPDVPLEIIGDGPLLEEVRSIVASRGLSQVEVVGLLEHGATLERLRATGMLIFPSIWYEGLPTSILEALSAGVPVVASDLGAQAEVVKDGVSGLLFASGDSGSLVRAVRQLRTSDGLAQRLSNGARREFAARFSPERSLEALMAVYESARDRARPGM